jgi:general secretion pathway protein A
MYEQYFGLRERPFDLSPNPRFLFLGTKHREALVHLRYGLTGRPGLTLLLGEAGTGKTTLVKAALQAVSGRNAVIVHLSNPTLTRSEFYEYVACGFGFGAGAVASKTTFLRELEHGLAANARDNKILALVVDEAQSLSQELLEEIRLLTNTETAEGRTMAVAIVGQPELAARLNDPRLRQLKQRINLRCELSPFELRETAAYIAARVRVAGGNAEMLFTRDAVVAVHERSKGIPRTISVICDNALVNGFATDVKPVGRGLILEVCRDFELDTPAGEQHAPPAGRALDTPAQSPTAALSPAPAEQAEPEPERSAIFGRTIRPRRFSFF